MRLYLQIVFREGEAPAELAGPATPQAQQELRPPKKLAIEYMKRGLALNGSSRFVAAKLPQVVDDRFLFRLDKYHERA